MNTMKFPLGQVVATPGALAVLAAARVSPSALLARHGSGDWGTVDKEDAQLNDRAVKDGGRILSSYSVEGERIWVITEGDRSSTCVLLAEEY